MSLTSPHDHEQQATASGAYRVTYGLPPHLADWQLPPDWRWGAQSVWIGATRHSMEVIDSLDRSLSLMTAPDPAHHQWLLDEARFLGHLHHRLIPTTYHVWNTYASARRGPGYLRHWIDGESLRMRVSREGRDDLRTAIRLLRDLGSAVSYLHDRGRVHGALSPDSLWFSPLGEMWLLGWHWAMPRDLIPAGLHPDSRWMLHAPEWGDGWAPTPFSDQWQIAAAVVASLTAEAPPSRDVPPVALMRPEAPDVLARVLDQALSEKPEARFPSVAAMLRDLERGAGARSLVFTSGAFDAVRPSSDDGDVRLRRALGDDYELLAKLGTGSFGDVWRVRDLALERQVALKMLHPRVANDVKAVMQFRREARLAAQLSHPSIVPIYDWDSRGGAAWFTMELMEYGSLADLVRRSGPRPLREAAPAIAALLDGLAAAHAAGILHRDLKPENILIDRWRRWRIGDFGLASREGLDRMGASGTPAFAAPEQLLNEHQGPAVDLFAMAGIALFALTGRQPFGEGDLRVLLARQLAGEADLSGLPEPIAVWVSRGLAPRPEDRWPSAAEMREAWLAAVEAADPEEPRVGWLRGLLARE